MSEYSNIICDYTFKDNIMISTKIIKKEWNTVQINNSLFASLSDILKEDEKIVCRCHIASMDNYEKGIDYDGENYITNYGKVFNHIDGEYDSLIIDIDMYIPEKVIKVLTLNNKQYNLYEMIHIHSPSVYNRDTCETILLDQCAHIFTDFKKTIKSILNIFD